VTTEENVYGLIASRLRDLITLAERICDNPMPEVQAWSELKTTDGSAGPAAALVHQLTHFVADSDICALDPHTRAMHQQRLREAIAALHQGTGS